MKNVSSNNTIKNISASIFSYLILFGAGLLARRLLIDSFETELVAYDGLLADIFSFIGLADLGSDGIFSYRLYKAFANNDENDKNKLTSLYRLLFLILGIVIAVICFVLYFFLPIIFKEKIQYWSYFNTMYIFYSITAIISYFFGYWRRVIVAAHMEYKAIRVETVMSFISTISKIIILSTTKDYALYLCVSNICTILSYILVSVVSRLNLKTIKIVKSSINEFKERQMLSECKDLFIIKIAETVCWCSTNLFTTLFVNVNMSAYFYNYSLIGSVIYNLLAKAISTTTSTIADIIYTSEKDYSYKCFKMVDIVSFFISSILYSGFYCVLHSVIIFIFGEDYLLSDMFLFLYSLQYYITTRSDFVGSFRNCFGEYKKEKKSAILSLISCVLLSFLLSNYMGISGIVIGTISSVAITWVNRSFIVIKEFFNKPLLSYYAKEIVLLLVVISEGYVSFILSKNLPNTILGIVGKGLIAVLIPLLVNTVLFYKTSSFKDLLFYMKEKGIA